MVARRALIAGGAIAAVAAAGARPAAAVGVAQAMIYPAQTGWVEPPAAPAREIAVRAGDVTLVCWDTGGSGPAAVLLHPLTGNLRSWPYQQAALAARGFRVIAFSRRGFYGSEPGPADHGSVASDLYALLAELGVARFHLVGVGAGGFVVSDFALAHPGRLLSATIASSLGGIDEPAFAAASRTLTPPALLALPPELKELGPSYRAGFPVGVARWNAIRQLNPESPPNNSRSAGSIGRRWRSFACRCCC